MRMAEMNLKKNKPEVIDLTKRNQYIEYPEEIQPVGETMKDKLDSILKDPELKGRFFDGVSFEKDSAPEA